jgi:hypothetical protein
VSNTNGVYAGPSGHLGGAGSNWLTAAAAPGFVTRRKPRHEALSAVDATSRLAALVPQAARVAAPFPSQLRTLLFERHPVPRGTCCASQGAPPAMPHRAATAAGKVDRRHTGLALVRAP